VRTGLAFLKEADPSPQIAVAPPSEPFVAELAALGNRGIRPLPSKGNFVLVLFEGALSAEAAYEGLTSRGFLTRWLPGQGLAHGLRITIGTPEQMRAVAAALREMPGAAR
jgi:histidinol-phosphate aminotransferase